MISQLSRVNKGEKLGVGRKKITSVLSSCPLRSLTVCSVSLCLASPRPPWSPRYFERCLVFTYFFLSAESVYIHLILAPSQPSVGHLKYVVQHQPPLPTLQEKWEQKTGGKSCQLAANETSLWRYPNLQGANVYDAPSASPSSLFSPPTCASPICPCTQPSAVATRGNSGALCVIIHTWPWPPVLWAQKEEEEKKCLRYG